MSQALSNSRSLARLLGRGILLLSISPLLPLIGLMWFVSAAHTLRQRNEATAPSEAHQPNQTPFNYPLGVSPSQSSIHTILDSGSFSIH